MVRVPPIPESWHILGPSRGYGRKPRAHSLNGKKFVVYRDRAGRLIVLSGICPHQGANLANGVVIGDRIACPFHKWEFGAAGACERIPSQEEIGRGIPDWAKVPSFPTAEQCGFAFFWHGERPKFPLPFFEGEDSTDFFGISPAYIKQKGRWYMVGANAFDVPHLAHVHKRYQTVPARPEFRSPHRAHVTYQYRIGDTTFIDHALRFLFGDRARLDVTVWGGNFLLVKTQYGPFRNYFFNLLEGVPPNDSRSVMVILSAGRGRGALFRVLRTVLMKLQAFFSWRFFQLEADSLEGVEVNPATLVESDEILSRYMEWFQFGTTDDERERPGPKPEAIIN